MRPGGATTTLACPSGALAAPGTRSRGERPPSAQSALARIASNPVTSLASSASLPPPSLAPTSITQVTPSSTRTCTYEGPLSTPTARLAAWATPNRPSSAAGGSADGERGAMQTPSGGGGGRGG